METIRANNVNTDYIRGLLPWFGFKSTIVDYDRPKRVAGKTGFSLLKMIRLGLKGLLSFSILPLRLGLFVGISVIFSGIVFVIYLLYNYLINDEFYKLLEWLAAFTYILLGFLFVLIWILAEYIFSISNNVKGMPMYVVDEVIENQKD
jgi:dolichol-phosphate mannosyltransferase